MRRLLVCILVAMTLGCVSVSNLQPGERPAIDTDEAGLWMTTDRIEEDIKTSGLLVRDPELNEYLKELACRLSSEYCGHIRIYVMNIPEFNATMMPNGAMQVWTGLLLRCQNEAQLAAVLGHEIAHFKHRDTLERWRKFKSASNAALFVGIASALVGLGPLGPLAGLGAQLSVLAFTREQEREADRAGLEMLVQAGLDPREAARIWQGMVAEIEASEEDDGPPVFLRSHPTPESRVDDLAELAADYVDDLNHGVVHRERFFEVTQALRSDLLRQEIQQRRPKRSEVVFQRLEEAELPEGLLDYYRAELYRLRNDEGDADRAITFYQKAIKSGAAPPQAHRELGILYHRQGYSVEARKSFARYLQAEPNADDRLMIQSYLEELP